MSGRAEAASAAEEGPDDHADGGLIVEHYRVDPSRRLLGSLGIGSLIMAVGSLTVAAALLLPRQDVDRPVWSRAAPRDVVFRVTAAGDPIEPEIDWSELGLGLLGLACIVTGGGIAIVGLNRVLREERFLALRTDGAFFRAGRERSLIKWEDVEAVRWDEAEKALIFVRHDGTAWRRAERYAGVDGSTLAGRAADVRRKALFGLLG